MKFLDAILGRTKPKPANLDALFAVPTAAVTLEASLGLRPAGAGAVCFRPAAGVGFAETRREIDGLLGLAAAEAGSQVTTSEDSYGYAWVAVRDDDVGRLVTCVHMATSTLVERGFASQLLASVLAFTTPAGGSLHLVYLIKRGTFYPFAPTGPEQRDNALELSVRGALATDLTIEPELTRWFPIWGVPLP